MLSRAAAMHRIGYDSKTALDPVRFFQWAGWQYQKRLDMVGKTWADQVNEGTLRLRGTAWVLDAAG
jgi:hypothetical protein